MAITNPAGSPTPTVSNLGLDVTHSRAVEPNVYVMDASAPQSSLKKVAQVRYEPVEYRNGSVVLDFSGLDVDDPLPFRFENHWLLVVKRADGNLDFYMLPE